MNHPPAGPRARRFRAWLLIALIGLAAAFVPNAMAKPIATDASISDRVRAQTELCEIAGGGKLTVTPLRGGPMNTTTCTGGENDGYTCVNEMASTECSQALTSPTEGVQASLPDTAENVQPTADPASTDNPDLWEPQAIYGEAIDSRAALVIGMCRNLGGSESVLLSARKAGEPQVEYLMCQGGMLDTLGCAFGGTNAWCAPGIVHLHGDSASQPDGAVVLPAAVPEAVWPAATGETARPEMVEEPGMGGTVVTYNQHGPTVDGAVASQVALCGILGGSAEIEWDLTADGGAAWADVTCTGGLMDGMYCANTPGIPAFCTYRTRLPDSPVVTPVPRQEQPADLAPSPTAPMAPTELVIAPSPTATAAPTMPPAEPTVPPTVVFPTIPRGNDVPPGEAEIPPEPTPTPHIIT